MIEDRFDSWTADQAPRLWPLTYPGVWPDESILLAEDSHFLFDFVPGRRLGQARVLTHGRPLPGDPECPATEVPLHYALLRYNTASVNNRVPVLAVGSNASPAQMRHKFGRTGVSLVVPMVLAAVEGLDVGVAPSVAPAGYVPATPIVGPDLASSLFIEWLDHRQLAALDATETTYTRVLLTPESGVRVTLPSGEVLGGCYAYVSDRGVLSLDGGPLRLGDQTELIVALLARSDRLRDLLGGTAQDWIDRTRAPGVNDAVCQIFAEEGWITRQPALDELATVAAAGTAPPRHYRHLLPVEPRSGRGLLVVSSVDPIDRQGQTCVRVAPEVADALGRPALVAVRPLLAEHDPDLEHMEALARLVVDDSGAARPEVVEVDQILRDGLGVEIGEEVTLVPGEVHRRRWPDVLVGAPLYVTCRVQSAELATIEREVCLLDALPLELLGVESGAEVVIEGCVTGTGIVRQIRVKAFEATDTLREQRENVQGGGFDTRYPSARDALGIHPDLTWIYLDSSTRKLLGTQDLGTVRIRASRSFQLRHELREMLLVLSIAFLGLVELVTTPWTRVAAIVAMVLLVVVAVSVRMRGRLTHRVIRTRDPGDAP